MRVTKHNQTSNDNDNNSNNRNNNNNDNNNNDNEPELTMDTPGPTPIEPPPEALAAFPIETTAVAVEISTDNDNDNDNDNNNNDTTTTDEYSNTTSTDNIPQHQYGESSSSSRIPRSPDTTTTTTTRRFCTVYAPATLDVGYTFTANVDGIDFVVTVPEGGVIEGEPFQVPYPTAASAAAASTNTTINNNNNNNIQPPTTTTAATISVAHPLAPTGYWRTDLCSFCEVCSCCCDCGGGSSGGMAWQGFFCYFILLGQVMTRLKLNACGSFVKQQEREQPQQLPSSSSSLRSCRAMINNHPHEQTIGIILFVWIVLILCLLAKPDVFLALFIPFLIYQTMLMTRTRYFMRQLYNIPVAEQQQCNNNNNGSCCCCCCCCDCNAWNGRMEDCCYSFWCPCCTTIQMARHTHSEVEYPYQCCSPTGLRGTAPDIVPINNMIIMDNYDNNNNNNV